MFRISFTYYEVIDKNFTGVVATVPGCGSQPRQLFANFESSGITKRVYANQREEFQFRSRTSAMAFLLSNAQFRQVTELPDCVDD